MTPPDHVGDDPVPHAGGGSQGLSTARLTGLLNNTYAQKSATAQSRATNAVLAATALRAGFQPNQVSGLCLDLDADTLTGADSSSVTAWADLSGYGNHLTTPSATPPILRTGVNGVNGHNCVTFTGTSSTFLSGNVVKGIPTRVPFTAFVVMRSGSASTTQKLLEVSASGTSGYAVSIVNQSPNFTNYGVQNVAGVGGVGLGEVAVVEALIAADKTVDLGKNFASRAVSAAMSADIAGTPNVIRIGSYRGTADYLTGDIVRVLLFNRALSSEERLRLTRWLVSRYRITGLVGSRRNASAPQTTPTYDGTGQGTHPDVLYSPTGVGNMTWPYVMAFTPYAGANPLLENPSLLVSTDGSSWQVPPGLTNPVDPAPGGSNYDSDTDLVLTPQKTFGLVYREVASTSPQEILHMRTSPDGITWSSEINLFDSTNAPTGIAQRQMLSPTIVWDGSQYVLFAVREISTTPLQRVVDRYTAASLTGPWSPGAQTDLTVPSANASSIDIWHADVELIDGIFYMLINDQTNLYFAASRDGLTWTNAPHPFMTPGKTGNWDAQALYRSCFILSDDGSSVRVWYAAYAAGGTPVSRIGYVSAPVTDLPYPLT